uniref:Reverse transcriptase domain-containing protein n=1 Tax=Tanacetum cinerariifolium TaxID=118510 RepID=A0A699IYQ7_TANCI|nr:reverse transcriptase domain-containing protein [Tanacetum cinerariifolium]
MNTISSSGLRTLPSNTITNPKEYLKGITTRSGNAYKGHTITTTSSSPPKVVERETEVTKDTVPPTNNRSTKDVQPPVVHIDTPVPNSEPIVSLVVEPVKAFVSAPKPNPKPLIPYPSKFHDQKLHDKTNDQKEKFFQIFKYLDFNISFAYALILMTKLRDQKLRDKANDQKEKFFQIFQDLNFNISFAYALILMPKRSFLNTRRALIDVYVGELTLRVGKEALVKSTLTKFLDFPEFLLEEIDAFLAIDDEPISPEIDESYYDSEGDILLLKEFLNDDPSSPPLPLQELKVVEPTNEKYPIDEPPMVELKDLPPHLEYAFLEGDDKLPVIIAKDLKDEEKTALIKVLKSHKQALTWQLSDIKVKGIRSFLDHAGFYRRFIQDFSKIARPMTHLLEKDTLFFFPKECIKAFQTLKKKLTEAPTLVALDWDLPFELMCDASDFAIGAVLGQRKAKHFQPIHYARKTMTDAQAHYTTTEKELLAVEYAFEKFRPYLVLSKSIVYTDHSALKYLFNKQDAKLRLLRWVLLT